VNFVLDASVALSWLLEDAGAAQAYAVKAFATLKQSSSTAYVPVIWELEVANVIAKSEARGLLLENRSQAFLSTIAACPIRRDNETQASAFGETLRLARRYQLSAYDASYLELALRLRLAIATLDVELRRAARQAGVKPLKFD
jgi:predicted nucleic acid-binding protein